MDMGYMGHFLWRLIFDNRLYGNSTFSKRNRLQSTLIRSSWQSDTNASSTTFSTPIADSKAHSNSDTITSRFSKTADTYMVLYGSLMMLRQSNLAAR